MIKEQVSALGRARWADFKGFTAGQKAVTVVAVLALLIGGYLFATSQPAAQYAPLYSNLAATDASAITDKLTGQHIPYKLTDGGAAIQVPTADVDKARLTVSAAGLPNSGQSGYALLDKEGVTTSQFQQQVDYQRAVEGELAKTIQSMSGVQAASVHLAIPQQDVFNDGSRPTTAAVLLGVAPATSLTASQVQSVVYLVSSSVPGLKTSNVTVTDSNGTVLNAPGSGLGGAVGADTQAQQTAAYNTQVAGSLQAMIDKALGPGHAVVTVNASLDFSKTSTTSNSYIYDKKAPPVSESKSRETYTGTGGSSNGTLGSPTLSTTGSKGNGKYDNSNVVVNNALGTVTKTTENSPGALQNLHIAVMLDKSAKNLNAAAISNLVRSGVGFSAARGDSLSVQAVPFDNSAAAAAAKAAAAATAAAAAAASRARLVGWVKQGLLVVLVLGIALGTWLASRRRRRTPPAEDQGLGLDVIGVAEPAEEAAPQLERLAPVASISDAATRRRALQAAAESRPDDVASALAGWLGSKSRVTP